jgi:MSHA biogenesis protein MshP
MNLIHPMQRGFAAIAAIFLVVVLAALGGFMLTFSNTQQITSAQDIQGSRAYWAARAGLEWGIAGVAATAPVPPAVLPLATCPVAAPPASVDGFTLNITCTPQAYTEAGVTVTIFKITSVASTGAPGSIGFIERSVSASLER